MTPFQRNAALATGFAIGIVLLVLLPMLMPDSNYLLPTYWKFVFGVTLFASGAVMVVTESPSLNTASLIAVGVMAGDAIRIAIDIGRDRSDHNLLPFELLLNFVPLLILALIGALAGRFATRETEPRRR